MRISYPVTFLIKANSGRLDQAMKEIQSIKENHPNAKISVEVAGRISLYEKFMEITTMRQPLVRRIVYEKSGIRRFILMYQNSLRRWIVKRLLGSDLIVKKRDTPSGPEWQLVDMKRRIPYGWVSVQNISKKDAYCPILPQIET